MAKFMPKEMRQIGTEMHRSATQFALIAQFSSLFGLLIGSFCIG